LVITRSRNPATEVAFPTKFAEYIATGRPVIVTRTGEIPIFVEKYNCGLVCDPTPRSISDAIMKAREMPEEELLKMGMNGRRLAEKEFDKYVIGRKYFEFLSDKVCA